MNVNDRKARLSGTTDWNNKQLQKAGQADIGRAVKLVEKELEDAAEILKRKRRAMLQELYDEDAVRWEDELRQLGLAIYKDRTS